MTQSEIVESEPEQIIEGMVVAENDNAPKEVKKSTFGHGRF